MRVLASDVLLPVTVTNDAIDGYDVALLEPRESFRRSGAIYVDCCANEESFTVDLVGDFQDAFGPRLRQRPARIGMSRSGVFHAVQKCRTQWSDALASATTSEKRPDGIVRDHYSFEEAWHEPVDQVTFERVVGQLAVAGSELFESLFERDNDTPLDAVARKLRSWAAAGEDALTIQANKFQIPWRMLYTHPPGIGDLRPDGSNFRAEGFWGYQHILEQFPEDYTLHDRRLIAKGGVLSMGAALNTKIDADFDVACIAAHHDFVKACGNRLSTAEWTDTKAVKAALAANPFPHQILYMLCHAEGAGKEFVPNANPWIEIDSSKISVSDLRAAVKNKFGGEGPFVFLNACRGGQYDTLTTQNYSFASEFLGRGAKGFLGAQIEVPAIFAGAFGNHFFARLLAAPQDTSKFAGFVLRDVTREFWDRRNPLGLVYSLYSGADCHIVWNTEAEDERAR